MQDLNWDDLRVFKAIADTGQIGKAAQSLHLDPTTLSRRLRRLEGQMEAPLFERTRDGQTLTEAGERLLDKVEAMESAASSITEQLSSHLGLSGTLRISVSEGFGSQFLTRHIGAFLATHPHIKVDLVANSGFLSPSKREADIAVMLSRPRAGPVICQKLADYRLRLYASPTYLDQHGAPSHPRELADSHRLIGYVPDLLYAPELNYLGEFHSRLEPQLRSSSINAQMRLIEQGVGIGVLPCFIGDANEQLVTICPETSISRTFWLVTHQDNNNLLRIREGKAWLRECVTRYRHQLMPR